jgi:hypothetical protein
MSYFKELPDMFYQSPFGTRHSSTDYVRTKNLFRRVKLRDDLNNAVTLFDKYEIAQGARPDTVADELFGSPEYDWVVLMTAGITNVTDQWPLSDKDIFQFAENKYGTELNAIHHYETKEVKDSSGRLILPKGKVVDASFRIPKPGTLTADLDPTVGISNYEFEVRKNNAKRGIFLLRPQFLQQFLNEMRTIMHYDKSSQFVDRRLISTENTRNTSPQ